ncbi:MAG: DUF3899 domain-containing protein [Candidatus Izemoplasmatales bacterium]|jgi:hypothetical protein|nr:DUF3899 domain-containing protein [Candidatus Izemoplasmatales bacterium]MDD3865416.1 DUF3899 domain-containing protein [Candidatus Izemoplasmatales bacterium]
MKVLWKNDYFRYILIDTAVGLVLMGLMLLYSLNVSLSGFVDAVYVSGFLLFTIGWFFYASNNNLFDLMVYGVQSFWKGVFGKKMKKSYIEYVNEKTKVKPSLYRSFWLASISFFITGTILYIIFAVQ